MNIKRKIKNFLFKKIVQKDYKNKLLDTKINKILIIRDGGIGDAICSYPLIRELKKYFKNSQIDIYASRNNYFMYKYVPEVNKVYLKHKKRHWIKTLSEVIKMRKVHYDLAIDDTVIRFHRSLYTMTINPKFALALAGKKERYGFNRENLSFYYKTYQAPKEIIHITEERLKVLELLGIKNYDTKMCFYLPNKKNKEILDYINKFKNFKLIGLNTDASHKNRTLNSKQIINLCKLLDNEKIKIIPFCIPSKLNYFENLIKNNNLTNVILPFKTKSIYEAAEIVNKLDLIITPDTSFVHIASGLNIPTIGLFWNSPDKYILCAPKSEVSVALKPIGKEQNLSNIDIEEIACQSLKILKLEE